MINDNARHPQGAVIGPSDAAAEICEAAERVGAMLGRLGVTVITGGRGGVMEFASRGARKVGGITVGIVQSTERDEANKWCSVVIPTGLGQARNVLMALAGDFVIVIGSSAGTLSEICFAWVHNKPVFVLSDYGHWSERIGAWPLDPQHQCAFIECDNVDDLEKALIDTCKTLNLEVQI